MEDSMFKFDTLTEKNMVKVNLDKQEIKLPTGMSVAAALLGTGRIVSRISPTSKKPCSPHCLMGVCFECMMEIDGVQRQACLTDVKHGMNINRNLKKEDSNEPS
jgi:predicted molibdopterin-dependent oxidoreductase YjgC